MLLQCERLQGQLLSAITVPGSNTVTDLNQDPAAYGQFSRFSYDATLRSFPSPGIRVCHSSTPIIFRRSIYPRYLWDKLPVPVYHSMSFLAPLLFILGQDQRPATHVQDQTQLPSFHGRRKGTPQVLHPRRTLSQDLSPTLAECPSLNSMHFMFCPIRSSFNNLPSSVVNVSVPLSFRTSPFPWEQCKSPTSRGNLSQNLHRSFGMDRGQNPQMGHHKHAVLSQFRHPFGLKGINKYQGRLGPPRA